MSRRQKQFYEFGPFRIDAANHLLLRGSEPVLLMPKTFDTLLLLVKNRDRVLEKDELMKALWPDSFVEEANLTQNIYILRKLLGQDSNGHEYIKTIPKRGYRFVAPVNELLDEDAGTVIEQQHARERTSIEEGKGGPQRPINSLAVLPLVNASADPHMEYLSDGITESIINSLSQLPQLRVIARSVVFRYKGREVDPQEVGRELGVQAALSGRVLQQDDRLIIRTELLDVAHGWQLWGAQYNRKLTDIFVVQDDISREMSEKLRLKLTGEDERRMTRRYTESTEAYHLYLKGRFYWNKRLTPALSKAIEYFQQAIEVDPAYALAYVGLADCYALLSLYSALTPREAFPRAAAAATRALEIDPELAEAHTSLGVIKLFYAWDWKNAEKAFEQAILLKPDLADAHQRYGMYLVAMGKFDEAIEELSCAQVLDPLSLIINTIAGYPFYYGREYDRAIKQYRKVLEMDPNFSMAHFRLGLTYAQKRMYEEALDELQKSKVISGDRDVIAALGYVYAAMGQREKAMQALTELEERKRQAYVSSYDMAIIYAGLNEQSLALAWLEEAFEERSYWLIYLAVDPILDNLRSDPRFASLMRRVGLSASS